MKANPTTLRFLFVGHERDWRPLKGYTPPFGRVVEMRSLPGNVVTWGHTEAEAVDNLRRALDRAFKRSGSPQEWYRRARLEMSESDRREVERFWKVVWEEVLNLERTDALEYATLREGCDTLRCPMP